MKRSVLFLTVAILLGAGLWSCDREENNGNNNGGNNDGGTTAVQWVDLGLPSGLLWADRNVGAQSPEDYGNYYAWGETSTKEVYTWDTYAYGSNYDALTKYCSMSDNGLNGFTDNLTTLEATDDAATVNIGGNAHTPTEDEWQELLDNTTSTWTSYNGIYGYKYTASNGKSIFLPAAGSRYGSNLDLMGEHGYYWSSSLDVDDPDYAWILEFISEDYYLDISYDHRYCGLSVRAVRASQK